MPLLYSELDDELLKYIDFSRNQSANLNAPAFWRSQILNLDDRNPVMLHRKYSEDSLENLQIKASADFGPLFIDGLADGIYIENEARINDGADTDGGNANGNTGEGNTGGGEITREQIDSLGLGILQAARMRMSKAEYIACPGCGRTLFDLQATLARIKERTSHLKGVKIGVMGCIVNGPGEMADADFGYVGSGRGMVTLYRGKEIVRRNIPQQEAIEALVELIKESGAWQ